ncbi:MAG TPA: MATE family efflux transporter [Spirochaetota bacterium]|nr:MATE family efflux transporter [Spirochaetota bacterium]HOL57959.1 MATE family efflux transporter [Spirochaetota bacterium]HPP05470.1 MATE family efflux transporter [Spirochaetota bacterium]
MKEIILNLKNKLRSNSALRKEILTISFPVMLQMLVEYLLNITDTAFIGHYNIKALSAITSSIYPYFMLLSLFFSTSRGTTILISQAIGGKRFKEARRHAEVSFIFNQLISLLYFIIWIVAGRNIISLVGLKEDLLDMGSQYISIISFQFLFFGLVISAESIFQGKGITYPIMIVSIVKTFLNIILDWLLIFGKFGLPELGIRGAALATLMSQIVSTTILLIFVFVIKKDFKLRIKGILRPNFFIYLKSLFIGIPAGVEFMLWVLGQNFLILMLNKYNPVTTGIFGIFSIILNLTISLYFGISIAAMNLVGKATGSNDPKMALKVGNLCILYSLIICFFIGIIFSFLPKAVFSIFTNDKKIIESYWYFIYILVLIIFPTSLNVVGGNAIRGRGDTKWMLYTQIPGTIFIVIMVYIFIFVLKFGIGGVLLAIFIDELWRGIANYLKFRLYYKN